MNGNRLPLRFAVPFLILIAGLLIVASAWLLENRQLHRDFSLMAESQIRNTAAFVAAEVEAAFRNRAPAEARAAVERAISNPAVERIDVVTPDGRIRFGSTPEDIGEPFEERPANSELMHRLDQQPAVGGIAIAPTGQDGQLIGRFPLQMRIDANDLMPNRLGSLYVLVDLSSTLARKQRGLAQRMLGWAGLLLLIAFSFWALLHVLLLRRIDLLVESVRAVGRGEFDREVDIRGSDELADLGRELRGMMTRLRDHSERLAFLADHDPLTGRLNRHGFEVEVERALRRMQRRSGRYVLALLDIDSLRVINDTQGHRAGDELLRAIADLLVRTFPESMAVARVGGDEFAVLLEIEAGHDPEEVARRLRHEVAAMRFDYGGERYGVQVSLGLIELDERVNSAADALGYGDAACYQAKEKGRGGYFIGSVDRFISERIGGEMQWVSRIQAALDEQRLRLYAQPIVPLGSAPQSGLHFEVLVRMVDETDRILPPGEFLAAAERYNLIHRIDQNVVGQVLALLDSDPGLAQRISTCSINLSGMSLGSDELFEQIRDWIEARPAFDASILCFEVTETAAISNLTAAHDFIGELRARGCRFALDDFGTGLSSFAYFKRLPVDIVKIDGVFVRDLGRDHADEAIVRAIAGIARTVGMKTIAEFVENDRIIERLRAIGVDFGQGYAFGKPRPIEELLASLDRSADNPARSNA